MHYILVPVFVTYLTFGLTPSSWFTKERLIFVVGVDSEGESGSFKPVSAFLQHQLYCQKVSLSRKEDREFRGSPCHCKRTAPTPVSETSTSSTTGLSGSGRRNTGAVVNLTFRSLKAWPASFVHCSELGFPFKWGVSGVATKLKLWVNLCSKFAKPRKCCSSLIVLAIVLLQLPGPPPFSLPPGQHDIPGRRWRSDETGTSPLSHTNNGSLVARVPDKHGQHAQTRKVNTQDVLYETDHILAQHVSQHVVYEWLEYWRHVD